MRTWIAACIGVLVLAVGPVPASAQIYFDLAQEAITRKAAHAGFDFERRVGVEPDSAQLIFKKREEQNHLICYLNSYGICYKFAYRLPAKSEPGILVNLNKHFTRRKSGFWENKEKSFLVELVQERGFTTVVYTPYAEAE